MSGAYTLRVSVIVPTLNAARTLPELLARLKRQTCPPDEILVVDSGSDDGTPGIAKAFSVRLLQIGRDAFDHGGTRDWAIGMTTGEIVCFFTQDALPMDDRYLEALLSPFADALVAGAYARQIAGPDARIEERLTRLFNYPEVDEMHAAQDVPRLGIKAYYLSNAASAYRKSAYEAIGGFDHPIPTNEDMLAAARFLRAGYRIAYRAQARVTHGHTFTLRQDFGRSFDIGAFLVMYADALGAAKTQREGARYVAAVSRELLKRGRVFCWMRFGGHCVARWLGSRAGMRYAHYSPEKRVRLSGNKGYWKRQALEAEANL